MRKQLVAIIVVRSDGNDQMLVDLITKLDVFCAKQSQDVKGHTFHMTIVPAMVARLKRLITCLT